MGQRWWEGGRGRAYACYLWNACTERAAAWRGVGGAPTCRVDGLASPSAGWVTPFGGTRAGFSVAERRCTGVGGRSLAMQTVVMYHRLILHEMSMTCNVSVSTMGNRATDKPPSTLPSTSNIDKIRGLCTAVAAAVF